MPFKLKKYGNTLRVIFIQLEYEVKGWWEV